MPPEMWSGAYSDRCDIWSAGVLLYVMCIGYMPFHSENLPDLQKQIAKGNFSKPREWKRISQQFKTLIKSILTRENTRPTISDLLAHSLIQPIVNERTNRAMKAIMKRNSSIISDATTMHKLMAGNKLKHGAFKYMK
jgi:serine/threonine protein kinase